MERRNIGVVMLHTDAKFSRYVFYSLRHNNDRKGFVMVEPRLLPDLIRGSVAVGQRVVSDL